MRKVVLVAALGLLTIWTGGCGTQEDGGEPTTETPAVESTPARPETATEETEQADEQETAEEPDLEAFEEPLVEQQQEETAAKAGLIQSTKPEERLLQLKGSANGNGTAAAPAAPDQTVSDPFGVLPPMVVQRTPDPEEAAESIDLTAREVPTVPEVPVAATPPQWTVAAAIAQEDADGNQGQATTSPDLSPRQVPSLPELPVAQQPPQAGTTAVAQERPGTDTQPGPTTTNGQRGREAPTPPSPQPPGSPPQPPAPPRPPQIPDLTVAQVPSLPELPANEPLPQWRDPNPPPPPPPAPVAVLPPPPSIEIAKAISVSGVMQVGDETRVILKAPTEPTSRYVSVGERIANGEVLVKRVKFNVGSDPIVIFEQNGVEVAVEVGTFEQTEDQLNFMQPTSLSLNSFNPS